MSIPHFNEQTAAWIPFTCRDKDRVIETPSSLAYQVDCLTTGVAIRASTAITPAVSSGEIALTPADTALQSQDNTEELRLITMTADAGSDTQHIETFRYLVKNLKAVT